MENSLEKYTDVDNCPVRNILDRIGDKWSILILLLLSEKNTMRFNELHKGIATISQKMLTVTLKNLEADGLVNRKVYAQIPPKVEYTLSPRGKSLIPHITNLVNWAKENYTGIQESRESFVR